MEKQKSRRNKSTGIQVSGATKVELRRMQAISQKSPTQSFMPFLFRNRKLKEQDTTFRPAPGQYDTKSNFESKNERDYLEEKYKVELQNSKKIKESVVFKSTAKRFNYKEASETDHHNSSHRISSLYKRNSLQSNDLDKTPKSKAITIVNECRVYPSIPDKSIKFGYSLGEKGKLNKIQKDDTQLSKEKENMKKYISNLKKEPQIIGSSIVQLLKEKQELLNKLKEKAQDKLSQSRQQDLTLSDAKFKESRKPVKKNNFKCNDMKIQRILEQKKLLEDCLGPGCYHADQKDQQSRPERFQFFNSSSERFPFAELEQKLNREDAFDIMKKAEIENKIIEARKFRSEKLKKGLKRSERPSRDAEKLSKKGEDTPGPGEYDPDQKLVKFDVGKTIAFNRTNRFTEMDERVEEWNKSVSKWRIRKDKQNEEKLDRRLEKVAMQRYAKVMKKNKQVMQKCKKSLDQIRQSSTKSQICWDNSTSKIVYQST